MWVIDGLRGSHRRPSFFLLSSRVSDVLLVAVEVSLLLFVEFNFVPHNREANEESPVNKSKGQEVSAPNPERH